jgi:hypothetical protein
MQSLLLVLFGWLLGLLAPAIQDRIRQKYRAGELRNAIKGEFNEFKIRMALVSYLMWHHLGPLTDDQLDWLQSVLQGYHGPLANPASLEAILSLRKLSESNGREIFIQGQNPGTGPYPKEYTAPFLAAHIGDLSVLPVPFQAAALHIKGQIDVLNQHVVFIQKRHDKTFDTSLSEANRQAVLKDLRDGYGQLAEMARRIADAITSLQG